MAAPSPARALELWLPDLRRFDRASPLRRLLARADREADGPAGYLGGLDGYFDAGARPLPAAALTRELLAGDAGAAPWLAADPAWIEPDINGARLLACGRLGLDAAEAEALAETLRPLFAEHGMRLETTTPDRWHLRVPEDVPLPDFPSPEQALGENLLGHLPQGPQGRRWRVLLNEAQVLLHQHPLNAGRRRRGQPPVNSLWPWGGGRLPATVESTLAGVCGDDPLLLALAARAGLPHRRREPARLADLPAGWLADLQDLPVDDIEQAWRPAIEAAARRRALRLAFASGERWRWRPWHRLRAWRGARA
ncbi:phosphoglycerate mutase [Fulvimonas soli]|jgi:hypothetical protein|uniref:Phosphoglycerate mutase n=1 Tax=Fulvimonas soli TaxID=155197 RepID=A0A316I8F8_9GAMM|nr:phosphoglycerate mutase [Fulvimonas soli]PWK89768.1 hypothetical protein C7456_104119 [Fulvimonas soli]TNY27590.1 phosphoglycerate mutase [Fulvimonas soli]